MVEMKFETTDEVCCFKDCKQPLTKPQGSNIEGGHNAQPLIDGRCCETCNYTKVLSARLEQMKEHYKRENN
jgi:hypothetical protein